ncbi:MAG: ASKHA domain-containing protein [Thermodesulfobacteriota bacterium]
MGRDTSWVKTVSLDPPSLKNNTADADRLIGSLKTLLKTSTVRVELGLLRMLPDLLRKSNYRPRCTLFKEGSEWILVSLSDPKDPALPAGMAVDVGTTTVVLRIHDLLSGDLFGERSFDNPQLQIGPDILTRIHFSERPEGLQSLKNLIIDALNRNIAELCRLNNISSGSIRLVSLAGNTTMTHLALGLNPRWMIREPYIPAVNHFPTFTAKELGINIHPEARIFIFPNIGSYFGGDLISGILFSGIHRQEKPSILVDVGTNAEVVFGNKEWLIACAGAAGPALEGGVTQMGMTAGPGVIDQVMISPITGRMELHTISNLPPKGICGSGLIDLAACLLQKQWIDIRGKFIPSACSGVLRQIEGMDHLVVVPESDSADGKELTLSQAELESLIRSKAAMYTILETLTGSVGLSLNEIETFYVAGTFGLMINPESAIAIGMLPDLQRERFKKIGNSAISGASMLLKSTEYPDEVERIRARITYLELNVNQEFMNRFSAAKFLPHTDASRFPSVKEPGS